MTREEIIESLIEAAREWKESKAWAAQNSSKLLSSRMTTMEAAEVMTHYFSKENALLDIIEKLNEIDGIEETTEFQKELEDLED